MDIRHLARVAPALLILASGACGDRPPPDRSEEGELVPYVPTAGAEWEGRDPAAMGFDPQALQAAVDYTLAHETTEIPEDPGAYLRARFEGIPHQEIVGPTAPRGSCGTRCNPQGTGPLSH